MWVEIICGLAVFMILWRLFYSHDAVPDDASSDSDASFAVAARLERLYGGKAFVGLRIPDPDTGFRQHIDVVLVTKMEVMVVAVRNFSGFVEAGKDGSWICIGDKKHKAETYPDPVLEVGRQVAILQSYLEQRGVHLPKGHIIGKLVLPNPNCRPAYSIAFQPEVYSFDKWRELKPESKGGVTSWIKDAFHRTKSEMQDGSYQQLNFILGTSPMWDRTACDRKQSSEFGYHFMLETCFQLHAISLELRGDRNILGEFVEFKGNQDDMQALSNLKRSKVSQFIIQKPTMLGFGRSRLQLLYSPRDYRSEGASASEWKEVAVKPNTEFLFQPRNSKKPRKFKLSSAVSLTLSA